MPTSKQETPAFDEAGELAARKDRLVALCPKLRAAEQDLEGAEEDHKSAKKRCEALDAEVRAIVFEIEAITKGTFQQTLPLAAGDAPIDEELWQGALKFLAGRRKQKGGFTVGGLALSLFGQKKADLLPGAQAVIDRMLREGLVTAPDPDDKRGQYWPEKEVKAEAVS
jgi:hypothetical protein